MQRRRSFLAVCVLVISLAIPAFHASPAIADSGSRFIQASGTAGFGEAREGSDTFQSPEIRPSGFDIGDGGEEAGPARSETAFHGGVGTGVGAEGSVVKPQPELLKSFNGLNFRQQRLANGGNQFSVEPPDQGLCAGNGFVLETVNTVMRVFDTNGNALIGVTDLNTFYGYIAQFNRSTGVIGPEVTDPSCLFDPQTQRWFHVVLTLEVVPSGANAGRFTGANHIDIAVSTTASPLGGWTIYRLPVQDDGTAGTPNHGCRPGAVRVYKTNPNACIGDFPHIGADKNGFYITTNEYEFFGPDFKAAQVYGFSKKALATSQPTVLVTQIDTLGMVGGRAGFTVMPARSASESSFDLSAGGVMYFMSSMAAEEVNPALTDDRIAIWALTNTKSLRMGSTPAVALKNALVNVDQYGPPPPSKQKAGDFPLGQCINDTTAPTPFGPGCWQLFFVSEPAHTEVEGPLDSSDSRMLSVGFARGVLWGTLDTAVMVGGKPQAGIAYYAVGVRIDNGNIVPTLLRQGHLAVANNNVLYGAVAYTDAGRGVIGFTIVGDDHYPSAAYVSLNGPIGPADIHIVAEGVGPQDGFTEYNAFASSGTARPRWGDYGAAVVDGDTVWLATEWIAQTCTLAQYMTSPIGSCGGTRASLGNWNTRITGLDLGN
jgi:hypothetical protein